MFLDSYSCFWFEVDIFVLIHYLYIFFFGRGEGKHSGSSLILYFHSVFFNPNILYKMHYLFSFYLRFLHVTSLFFSFAHFLPFLFLCYFRFIGCPLFNFHDVVSLLPDRTTKPHLMSVITYLSLGTYTSSRVLPLRRLLPFMFQGLASFL